MLPLQRKIRNRQRRLKLRALAGACAIYGCMLFFMFFSTYQSRELVKLTVNRSGLKSGSPVLFMTRPKPDGNKSGRAQSIQKKKMPPKKNVKKALPKKAVVKKPVQKKIVKKTTVKKIVPKKKVIPKAKVKPQSKKPVSRVPAKQKPSIKEQVNKAPLKKTPEAAKEKLLKKKNLEKPVLKPKKAKVAEIEQKKKLSLKPKSNSNKFENKNVPEELYVSPGYDRGTKAQIALSRAIGRNWRPPNGLVDDVSSKLQVSLKPNGVIDEVIIEEKSGVLAYDMAARGALWRVDYPREFWGKTIAISFGAKL